MPRVFKFASSAKSAKSTTQKLMGTRNTSMNDDYPSDEWMIVGVTRAKSRSYKALEKTSKKNVYEIKLKKKRRKR